MRMPSSTSTLDEPEDNETDAPLLRMARRGWQLFPVSSGGKQPLIIDWPNQASCDAEQIRLWLRRWPKGNWGCVTGPASGVFVVDVDGEAGLKSIQELANKHGYQWT